MKHVKIYRDFFHYGDQNLIISEISGIPASEIHHLTFRSHSGQDDISNLIALTREEHDRAHLKKKPYLTAEELTQQHKLFMQHRRPDVKID